MRKALVIVGLIAAYSSLEMGLLLSSIFSRHGFTYPSTYQASVWLGQLLLIPGLAALFSRSIYGPYGSGRRTMTILLAGSLGVPIVTIGALIPIAVLAWAADVSQLLFDLLLPLIFVGVVTGFFVAIRRSGKRGVQTEASRWLAERRSGIAPRDISWRRRGIYFASWIPVSMVLLFFLFLPEVWGMLSHLSVPQSGNLSGYQVPIPRSWIVMRHENQSANGWSISSGLAGRGIWHAWSPYVRGPLPFISWSFGTRSRDEKATSMSPPSSTTDEIVDGRISIVGAGKIRCVEHNPTYVGSLYNRWGEVYTDCSDSGRFFADFLGPTAQVETFYKVLGGISRDK